LKNSNKKGSFSVIKLNVTSAEAISGSRNGISKQKRLKKEV